ncbi:MAG: class I SAM-dependent DNA methyltransferase [Flavobacteriia bacterium]|jgi:SAM-dependent methyltransferase
MIENFNLYSQYYDLLYQDKAYSEEVSYIVDEIRSLNPGANSILELGCGSGGHAHFLSEEGFHILGIDQSETMIEAAQKKKIPNFEVKIGNIVNFDLNKDFDVAVSLFHVISYLTKNKEIASCFSSVNKHLKKNGIFVFDVWFSPAVYHLKPSSRTKFFENEIIKVQRNSKSVMDIHENTIDVHFDIQIENKSTAQNAFLQENHLMRHFSIPEMKILASNAGFEVLKCEELLSKNEPGLDTWAVCFVFKKVKEVT